MTHMYVREDGGGWPDSDLHVRRRPECSLTGNPQDQHQDPHDAGTLGALACGKPMAAAWAGVPVQQRQNLHRATSRRYPRNSPRRFTGAAGG